MIPPALGPFLALATALRQHGFPVSPEQTQGFIAAIGALGARDVHQVRRAALALFAIPPERREEFDAIFRAIFFGQTIAADAEGDDEEVDAVEPDEGAHEIEIEEAEESPGEEATASERLAVRDLAMLPDPTALDVFAREAPRRLPTRLSYRWRRARRGGRIDLGRALRTAARQEGELFVLPERRRKVRQRRIVLLIDVSGSMRDRSDALLAFAHTLIHAADRAEAFTLGTRLTRITTALSPADRDAALVRVGRAVADIDGGTRIGDALAAFMAVPRYAGFARGALVVVLSDGLERGDPAAMVDATRRLSRIAWRLHWLTPLAADPGYEPRTAALSGALPWIDALGDGASVGRVADHLLTIARAA